MSDDVLSMVKAGIAPPDATIPTALGDISVKFLTINTNAMGPEMEKQAANYGWVASAYVAATTEVANIEQELKERKAQLWGMLRRQKEEGRKLTVADMEHEVDEDPKMQELQRELINAQEQADVLKVVRDALRQKSRLIQSMVGLERSKMEMQLHADRAAIGEKLANKREE